MDEEALWRLSAIISTLLNEVDDLRAEVADLRAACTTHELAASR